MSDIEYKLHEDGVYDLIEAIRFKLGYARTYDEFTRFTSLRDLFQSLKHRKISIKVIDNCQSNTDTA